MVTTDIIFAQALGTIGCAVAAGGIATLSIVCIPNIAAPVHRRLAAKPASGCFGGKPEALATHLSYQWLDLYDRGHKLYPAITGLASLANVYVFLALRCIPTQAPMSWQNGYLLAASVAMSIVPWTALTMIKTNKKLDSQAAIYEEGAAGGKSGEAGLVLDAEESQQSPPDIEVANLLQKWAKLNLARAVFPFMGAIISFYATSTARVPN